MFLHKMLMLFMSQLSHELLCTGIDDPYENICFKNYYSSNMKRWSEIKQNQFDLNRARADKLVL